MKMKLYDDPMSGSELLARKQDADWAALAVMDGHLASRLFFVGEQYSSGDAAARLVSTVQTPGHS